MKNITRGFVTMATGREEYYILAHNLLLSYRYHCRRPMPFGIICDRENEYTADFDTVILMDAPMRTAFDKLQLPELAPYDETIFIEADCLAYRNLNGLWSVFKDAPDFGALGIRLPLDMDRGWIRQECLGPYRDRVKEQYLHQGGVYFMRKGRLDAFLRTVREIYLHLDDFRFRLPTEEPVFILACLLHGYAPVADWAEVFCYYPTVTLTGIDITKGRLSFKMNPPYYYRSAPGLFLVHWGTDHTREPLYRTEAAAVTALAANGRHVRWLEPKRIENEIIRPAVVFLKSHTPLSLKSSLWKLFHR